MQKSIFVQAPKGFVEPDKDNVVSVPADLKPSLLKHLRRHHDISTKTIYNDLQGFIEKWGLHESAYTEFYKGVTCQDRAESAKTQAEKQRWNDAAIKHYTEAIERNPDLTAAYNNRGNAYSDKSDFDRAIENFNIAIELNPDFAHAHSNRSEAWLHFKEWEKAKRDLITAQNEGIDIVAAFRTMKALKTLRRNRT